MATVIFVVGLPGSGKTYLSAELFLEKGPEWILVDDPQMQDRSKVFGYIAQKRNMIVSDPRLCNEKLRDLAVFNFHQAGYDIEWIFFENNEEKCRKNIEHRNDGRVIGDFKSYQYTIPESIIPINIWQPN